MIEYISHRVNKKTDMLGTPDNIGVELDVRDDIGGRLYMEHDPFKDGEDFESYLQDYHCGTMIVNVKSERIELKIKELLQKYKIEDYFFLDSTFPMLKLLSDMGEHNIAVRFSEFEGMDTIRSMQGKAKWVWADCFTKFPLDRKTADEIKSMGYKICIVSPELQGQEEKLREYASYIKENGIEIDAVCCKYRNIELWRSMLG